MIVTGIILWSALILSLGFWHFDQVRAAITESARQAAIEAFSRDIVYRQWAAGHGGVYVPVTPETPPNPYLKHVPERDITTPSGRKLTLVNPAYMTRQAHELGHTIFGLHGHITSLNPIRPANAPDDWERDVLRRFAHGEQEVSSIETLDGALHLRLMRPLHVNESCLSCHADQGYHVGDLRGGISVSLPWTPFQNQLTDQVIVLGFVYCGVWAAGLIVIVAGGLTASRSIRRLADEQVRTQNSERRYRRLFEAMQSGFAVCEAVRGAGGSVTDFRFLEVNAEFTILIGRPAADIIGSFLSSLTPDEESFWIGEFARIAETGGTGTFERFISQHNRYFEIRAYSPEPDRIALLVNDVTQRHQFEERLRASESRYRELFEAESDAILLIDNEEGRILEANGAASTLYGFSHEELLAKRNTELSAEPDETRRVTESTPIVHENVVTIPLRYHKNRNGTVFPVEITGRFFVHNGRPVHIAAIRDITQRMKAEEQIDRHHEQLRKVNEELDSFAHVVSHDLQAPLRRISGYIDLIRESPVVHADAELTRHLESVSDNARQLFELVESLLEFSRAKRGDIFRQPVDLTDMATRIIGELRQDDPARAARIEIAPGLTANADARLMRVVLLNLFSNAWKFSARKAETVISFSARDAGNERVFSVRDNGAGFDPTRVGMLFQPFSRLHEATEFKGRGIGLSIVSRIIERHGGRIWAEAVPGEGARFHFTIPE